MCDKHWLTLLREVLDKGGPTMHYQPIVDLWHGTIVGYEALARGFPGVFGADIWFSAAYHLRMTQVLELAAIRNAVAGFQGLNGYLSVNASPRLLATYSELADEFPPGMAVQVEVTETIPIHDNELPAIKRTVEEVRSRGGRIALDDAGQGYAFRNMVDLLPDVLKIDRVFVQGLHSQEEVARRAMMRSALFMAAQFNVEIVAEGVETQDEVTALRVLGATTGQGYWYSPARPAEELRGVVKLPREEG